MKGKAVPDASEWPSASLLLSAIQVFVEYIQPKDPTNGQMYQKTLLGTILSISCLLHTPGVVENHGYFTNPSRSSPQEIKMQESNIHQVGRYKCQQWQMWLERQRRVS